MIAAAIKGCLRDLERAPLAQRTKDAYGQHIAAYGAWLAGRRDDVAGLLRSMDIFVLGSWREGISNTILEAMACGLPIIATGTGGNAELVAAGESGTIVPPGDRAALADAIAVYAGDAALRARHGRAARERAVSQFSIAAMVASYGRLYGSALASAGVRF